MRKRKLQSTGKLFIILTRKRKKKKGKTVMQSLEMKVTFVTRLNNYGMADTGRPAATQIKVALINWYTRLQSQNKEYFWPFNIVSEPRK